MGKQSEHGRLTREESITTGAKKSNLERGTGGHDSPHSESHRDAEFGNDKKSIGGFFLAKVRMKLAPGYQREVDEKDMIQRKTQAMLEWEMHSKLDKGEEREFGLQIAINDMKGMKADLAEEGKETRWFWFDLVSGLLVISNAGFIGYEAVQTEEERKNSMLWFYQIEIGFLLLFIIELALRVMIGTCKVLCQPWNIFDFVIISVSVADAFVFQLLYAWGWLEEEFGGDMDFLTVLRVLRLARLVRLVRLVRLFEELTNLIQGLMSSFSLLFWALFTFFVMVYFFCVAFMEIDNSGQLADANPDLFKGFNRIFATTFRMGLFDGWGDIAREMFFTPDSWTGAFLFVLVVLFITVASLGILNLLVGVMITTAVEQAARDKNTKETRSIAKRFLVLKAFREHPHVERDLKEWYTSPKDEADRTPFKNRVTERHLVRWRKRWPYKHYFDEAGISMRDVKMVVDEISGASSSVSIDVDDFIEGCTWISRDPKAIIAFHLARTVTGRGRDEIGSVVGEPHEL
jgi:hypothetical protein